MGDPQLAYPVDPRHRHQRQGLDGADDHPPADGPRAHGRHLHQPAPRADQRAHQPQRRADQRRRLRRADRRDRRPRGDHRRPARRTSRPSPRPRSAGSPTSPSTSRWSRSACSAGGTPPTSCDAAGRGGHQHRPRPHRVRRADARPTSPARRPASSSRGSAVVIGETDPELVADLRRGRRRRATSCAASDFDVRRATSWRSAAGCSTCARRPRSTPTCSCRSTARHQGDNAAVALDRGRGVLRRAARRATSSREGFAEVAMPGPLRGARPPAAGDRRRRPQPARRRHVRRGVLRGLRSRRPRGSWSSAACRAATPTRCSRRCGPTSSTSSFACTAPSPRGVPAAERRRGGPSTSAATRWSTLRHASSEAVRLGAADAAPTADDAVLVTGSLYVVGAARPHLRQS